MALSRIRCLYLQPAPLFGGAERQAVAQALFLPEYGVDVTMMGGPGPIIADWMHTTRAEKFVHSDNFPGGWPPQHGLRRLSLPLRYVACGVGAKKEIEQLLRRERIDIIVASLPFTWITGTLAARRAGIPIVWRAGGARINAAQKASLWGVTRFLTPDVLLCNGHAVCRTFHPLVPADVEIVRNGVDPRTFNPNAGNPALYRPLHATAVLGYAARLAPAKRPQDVIELAARLRNRFPGVRLLVAGEGSRRAEYERMAKELGADNVTFLGFVSDMASLYAACDIVVLPSGSEGCSNVMLEAMACGKAVVGANIDPVLELLQDGHNGLIFPLGNVRELTEAVTLLLSEPALRVAIGERALATAKAFTPSAAAAAVSKLLIDLVLSNRAHRRRVSPILEPVQSLSGRRSDAVQRPVASASRNARGAGYS